MAKSPKVEATSEVTTEVTVTVTEQKADAAPVALSKATLEEIEAGKKALAKNAK